MKTKEVNILSNDTIIINRTRGWRTKMHNAIKSFPPAALEKPTRVAVIEISISAKVVTIVKKWRLI